MSFPAAFGSQVAAIMDVLSAAAVAEISKLVEDGALVLRLEMRRKDSEILELQRSLKMMEVELCKAQEAVISRAVETGMDQVPVGTQVSTRGVKEDERTFSQHQGPKPADAGVVAPENGDGTRLAVKREAEVEVTVQETTDPASTVAAKVHLEPMEPAEPIWPSAACRVFQESSGADVQMFPGHAEPFSAHRSTEYSYDTTAATAEEIPKKSFGVPIKMEVEVQPVCIASTASESVLNEQQRCVPLPVVRGNQCVPSVHQPPRRSPTTVSPMQRSAQVQDQIYSANSLRVKRLMNPWKVHQKVFTCSVCHKGFPRLSQLEEHKATHQTFKPFRCLECGKSFTQKTRLKSHQSVHTGERPFSCKICGKMFSRQDNCLRHERFHSGLKPYSCGTCGKSFTVQANLKIHQEIHLQGR